MNLFKLDDMTKGWFVGDFLPCALRSTDAEVAVKHYREGDREDRHLHKVAVEVTVIVSGRVRMNGTDYDAGDIIVIDRGEATDFQALTAATTVVVKTPSVAGDKYPDPGGPIC